MDGGIYNNNPCEIANDERKLLWPSEAGMHPDILLSLGTGHHGEASRPFDVTPSRSHHRGRYKQLKHLEDIPDPKERTKGPSSWSAIPRLGSFIKGMHNRFDNVLNAEETWQRFRKQAVTDQYSMDGRRYARVNPNLGFSIPKLDAKDKVWDIQRVVQTQMDRELRNPRSDINTIAQRLIASSFYVDVRRIQKVGEAHVASAAIHCRFPDDTQEIRSLGHWLTSRQNARFQPHFLYEEEQDARLFKVDISKDTIHNMVTMGTFTGPRLELLIHRPTAPSLVYVRLSESGENTPVSGFPRVLVDQLSPVRSHESGDSRDSVPPTPVRTRRRRSHRLAELSDPHSKNTSPRQNKSPTIAPGPLPRVPEETRSINSAMEGSSGRRSDSLYHSTPLTQSSAELPTAERAPEAPYQGFYAPKGPDTAIPQPRQESTSLNDPTYAQEIDDIERAIAMSLSEVAMGVARAPTDEMKDYQDTIKRSMTDR